MEPFYTRQTEIINRQVQLRDEQRGGLRSIGKGFRKLWKNLKKMQSKPKKIVNDSHNTEESVATADATKSLEASESIEELRNQPKPADTKKDLQHPAHESQTLRVPELHSASERNTDPFPTLQIHKSKEIGYVNLDELLKDHKVNKEAEESPFDTESEIKFIRKENLDQEMHDTAYTTLIGDS
ncbi:hypothetical protein Tco_1328534 [Tanacetum coccineum]